MSVLYRTVCAVIVPFADCLTDWAQPSDLQAPFFFSTLMCVFTFEPGYHLLRFFVMIWRRFLS